jgi:poly(A) polymerase
MKMNSISPRSTDFNVFTEIKNTLSQVVRDSEFKGLVYLVGGACRDHRLGHQSLDWDLVVERSGGAEDFAKHLAKTFPEDLSDPHPIGKGYPIWQIVSKENSLMFPEGFSLEIADTQLEMFPDANSRGRVTRYGNLSEDCQRRDLTINMLYWDFTEDQWKDPSGYALEDIQNKIIRGYPGLDLVKIFSDDPLRVLRLIRFQTVLGWSVESFTLEAAKRVLPRLKILSFERIRDEWEKLLNAGLLYKALDTYREIGVLEILFPELLPMVGCEQDKIYHSEGDVWVHTLGVMRNCGNSRLLQLTGLLHDVGKPQTQSFVGNRIKFIDHEKISVNIAEKFLDKMKYGSDFKAKVLKLVALHLRGGDVSRWSTLKPARKLLRDAGDLVDDLILFIEADSGFSLRENGLADLSHIPLLKEKIADAKKIPERQKPLISGHELMELFQKPAGAWIKVMQNQLREFEDDFVEKNGHLPDRNELFIYLKSLTPASTL